MSITINQQAQLVRNAVAGFAQDNNGTAEVASDLAHLWKMAYIASDKLRILIAFTGENARGPFSLAAATFRVDRQFTVLVTRGRGFSANRAESLTDTVQNAPPLYDLVDTVRNIIRTITNASVELPVDFKAIRTLQIERVISDAYMIEFSLAADLPRVVDQPVDPIAIPPPP
jgi:hypothetical protein